MTKTNKIFSLILVFMMVTAAAITVNKSIFGHTIASAQVTEPETAPEAGDTITLLPDGSVVINTTHLASTVTGYAGPVPLEVRISDGTIADITPLPNAETPSFFRRASKLFDQWIGKTPQQALEMQVDGVTGATYTSNAIISNMNAALDCYKGSAHSHSTHTPFKVWIALLVTIAACILPLFFRNKIYHNIQLVANIVVLGFWCGQFLDYAVILRSASSGFTLPVGLIAIVMLIAAFIYPLFGHPQHYCTHICPLGAAQQLVSQICGYKICISTAFLKHLDTFRRLLWAILMLLLWSDTLVSWMDLELFQAFQFRSAPWPIIIVAVLFIALSAVVNRPYCRFVCPTGSLFKRAENIG